MDVRKWQAEAREDLIKKLGIEAKLKALRVPLSPRILWQRKVKNGTITKLILQSEKDYSFPAYLCIPDGNGPFPVWICVQGHGTGMHASISVRWQDEKTFKYDGGDRNFVEQCLERGYAALCIEQRAMGERSGYSDHRPGCLRQARHNIINIVSLCQWQRHRQMVILIIDERKHNKQIKTKLNTYLVKSTCVS